MEFEIGKKYRTRGGSIAEITGIVPGDIYSVWALVDGGSRGYTRDGQREIGCENDLDLVEEIVEEIVDTPPAGRRWTVVISSYTGHVSDQLGIEGEVLNVVPESRILDAESEILELEKQASRYQATVADLLRQIESQNEYIDRRDGVIADLEACIQRLRGVGDHPGKSQPFVEVGGAYLTRGGDVAIVIDDGLDDVYPFDVRSVFGDGWSASRNGSEFDIGESGVDLVSRIRFPEANVVAPEGFVCVGNKLLPEYHDAEDIKVCSWGDNEYCVRIGSPVHFAFATKFSNEA